MLVTNKKPSEGIEIHPPFVETRREGIEEFRRYHEDRHVLKIWVEVEAVASDVVRIVVPLPPPNADSGKAVSGQDLHKPVESTARHDLVMTGVVANPPTLDPQKPHQPAGKQMNPNAFGKQNAINADSEQHCDQTEGEESDVPFLVEEAHFGELVDELSVVLGDLGDGVVSEIVAGEELVEILPGFSGVVGDEGIGGVLASEVKQWMLAAGVGVGPVGDIVDLSLDGDPEISWLLVLPELFLRNVLPWLCHWSYTEI